MGDERSSLSSKTSLALYVPVVATLGLTQRVQFRRLTNPRFAVNQVRVCLGHLQR